jgi:hypothetical protein
MSMIPFLDHVDACKVCRANRRTPCAVGASLLKEGAERLTKKLIRDPGRAKA